MTVRAVSTLEAAVGMVRRITLGALFAWALTACGGAAAPSQASAPESGKAPPSFNVGLASDFVTHDIAIGDHLYEKVAQKFHTTIQFPTVGAGVAQISAIKSGAVNFVNASASLWLAQAAQATDLEAVFDFSQGGQFVLVGQKKFETSRGTGLDALKKYEGGTWGIVAVGGAPETYTKLAAESVGVSWPAQKVVAVGNNPAALVAGRVDITALSPDVAAAVIAAGNAYLVFNSSGPEARKVWGLQLGQVLLAQKTFVQSYPELTRAIVQAELQGLLKAQQLSNSPKAVYALLPAAIQSQSSDAVFAIQWPMQYAAFQGITGALTRSSLDDTLKFLIRGNILPAETSVPAAAVDNGPVLDAYKRLGQPTPRT